MSDTRIRFEIEHRTGSVIRYVDLAKVTEHELAVAGRALDDLIAWCTAEGIHEPEAHILEMLLLDEADEQAYERVAARRGVLAL